MSPDVPTEPSPFGVYIHWPFCAQKCPYCDFNSHVRHGGWDEARFLAAYRRELDHVAARLSATQAPRPDLPYSEAGPSRSGGGRTVGSVFFGGGTPSLMQPATVAAILDHIASLWPIADDAEITLEANTGSVEAGRFAGLRSAGINRVSIGVQSLRDDELRRLGRIHTVAEATAALAIARRTFDRVSFYLIYARPEQSPRDWRAELGEALSLAGAHLSLYQLTIEPGTPFEALHRAGKLRVPDGDTSLALYELTEELTERAGLPAYEVSNHAAPGEECRHNLLYWRYGEYAGVGPGAHGRLLCGGVRHATVAHRNPEEWASLVERSGGGYSECTALSLAEEADERLLMGLRLTEGLDLAALSEATGRSPGRRAVDALRDLGMIEDAPEASRPLGRGQGHRVPAGAGRAETEGGQAAGGPPEDFCSIRACAGPGAPPFEAAPPQRIRATPRGRLVLNEVVRRLSESMTTAPASAAS